MAYRTTAPSSTVTVTLPQGAASQAFLVTPGSMVVLQGVDLNAAHAKILGNNLVISQAGHGDVVLLNFVSTAHAKNPLDVPTVRLTDGSMMQAPELLTRLHATTAKHTVTASVSDDGLHYAKFPQTASVKPLKHVSNAEVAVEDLGGDKIAALIGQHGTARPTSHAVHVSPTSATASTTASKPVSAVSPSHKPVVPAAHAHGASKTVVLKGASASIATKLEPPTSETAVTKKSGKAHPSAAVAGLHGHGVSETGVHKGLKGHKKIKINGRWEDIETAAGDMGTGGEGQGFLPPPVAIDTYAAGPTISSVIGASGGRMAFAGYPGQDLLLNPVPLPPAAANAAPVVQGESLTTQEDTPVTFSPLANDTDADGDVLSISALTQPAHGTVVLNPNGTVTYTPAANFNGPDAFTYTVSDGHGGVGSATVSLSVTPVNDVPAANNDTANATEDTPLVINVLANDTDVDGDPLTVSAFTQPTHGTLVLNPNGTFTYTPTANFNGADTFTYTASDGHGGTDTATVNVTVGTVNDAPVAVNDSAQGSKSSGSININVLANDSDPDGGTLSVTSASGALRGTVTVNPDNTVTYTATQPTVLGTDYSDSFTYTISDGQGGTSTATATVLLVDDQLVVGPVPPSTVNGDAGNDVLMGDGAGQSNAITQANTYNMVITLDISNSMNNGVSGTGKTRMTIEKEAAVNLVNVLESFNTDMTFTVVTFSNGAWTQSFAQNDYTAVRNYIDSLTTAGVDGFETHYDDALNAARTALDAATPTTDTHKNVMYFVSDGFPEPVGHGPTDAGFDWQTYTTTNDITVHAIGIGSATLDELNVVDTTAGAVVLDNPADLTATLESTVIGTTFTTFAPNADTLHGFEGNDIIFGDALNTDWIAGIQPGASILGLQAYLEGNAALNPTGYTLAANPLEFEQLTINYIRAHMGTGEFLNTEDPLGADDQLFGEAGTDTLLGQGGNDTLDGGTGADSLYGGAGNDTLNWDHLDTVISGGSGTDTLLISADHTAVNLSNTVLSGIEAVNAENSVTGDSLTVSAADILRASDTDTVAIFGDAGDSVTATGLGTRGADVTQGGHTYAQFTDAGNTATLMVELGMTYNGTVL